MAAPPAQYAQWSAPAPQADGPHDEVRTIFVLGFPPDVKERELQNLLRWWPGYEASQMNFKGDQPMGFALFSTAAMAMAARDALQNLVFDADTNSVLRAEMAKKNLYVKRGVAGEITTGFDASKRMRTGGNDYSPAPYPAPYGAPYPNQVVPAAAPSWGPQGYVAPAPQYEQYAGYAVSQPVPIAPTGYAPVQPGFRQMKVVRQGKNTVCFIEFVDVNTAMTVHSNLQGAVLSTSDRGGMRIQYSKNPYGRKKDGGVHQGAEGGAQGLTAPGVENNGFLDHTLPPDPSMLL